MKQVFISYQHDDGDFADVLIQKVKEAGFPTWIDNDQLQAGTDWREGIDHAIKASCALIVIMSPAAKASEYVTYEWAFAWGQASKSFRLSINKHHFTRDSKPFTISTLSVV